MVFALLILFSVPTFADNPKLGLLYDIQCGCYSQPANAARLALRLQELGLSWYSLQRADPIFLLMAVYFQGRSIVLR